MKIGQIVRHKKSGYIGKISEILETTEFFDDNTKVVIRVKFLNLPKKYTGIYDIYSFEPYVFPDSEQTDTLNDWLSNPHQKLRNVLANKKHQNTKQNTTKGKIRLDGRNMRYSR